MHAVTGVPLWDPLHPDVSGSRGRPQGYRGSLTLVLPSAPHIFSHAAKGAEQGGQGGAGYLTAHEVLQVRAPCLRLLGGPGLQVVDLGFKCLRSQSREKEGGRDGEETETETDRGGGEGAGKQAPGRPALPCPGRRQPDSGPLLAAWTAFSWENGSCLAGLTGVVTGSPRPSVSGGASSQAA